MSPFRKLPVGERCPGTTLELDRKSAQINCTKEFGTERYHCLRNEKGQLGTICIEPSWIQKDYCPEYNEVARKMDAETCDKTLGVCPGKTFLSNDVISYSACLYTKENQHNTTTTTTTTTITNTKDTTTVGPSAALTIAVPVIVVCLLIILVIVIYFAWKRRRKHRNKSMPIAISAKNLEEQERMIDGEEEPKQIVLEDEEPPLELKEFRQHVQYFDTLGGREAKKTLLEKGWIILKGITGSGKTTLGLHILSSYHNKVLNERKCRTRIIQNIDDLDTISINSQVRYILFVDDLCERWEYLPGIVKNDLETLKRFYDHVMNVRPESRYVYLIFTMQSQIWELYQEKFQFHPLFDISHVVDLQEEPYKLKREEILQLLRKMDIAYTERQGGDIDSEALKEQGMSSKEQKDNIQQLTAALDSPREIGVHQLIKLVCKVEYFRKCAEAFVEKTEQSMMDMFTEMCDSRRKQYFSLNYLLLKGGTIDIMDDKDGTLLKNLARIGLKGDGGNFNSDMKETMLVKVHGDSSSRISFLHETILLYLFKHFNKCYTGDTKIPAFFIENCEPSMLLKFVRTENSSRETDKFVIKANSINTLVKRLAEYHAGSHEDTIYQHVLMSDPKFKKEFENERRKKKYQSRSEKC